MENKIPRLFRGLVLGLTSIAVAAAVTGCHKIAASQVADNSGADPADVNTAQVGNPDTQTGAAPPPVAVMGARSAYTPQQNSEQYSPQQAAPVEQAPPPADSGQGYDYNAPNYDQGYDQNQVDAGQQAIEQANEPPPPLPVYQQPEIPGPDYLWTPGYWGWGAAGYYWIPGAWCAPPFYGALWTPGYWGFYNSVYVFHRGYWGPHIGFYGGINYGFGYTGYGYHGGYWNGNHFYYNRTVNNINVTRVTNVYNRTVVVNNVNRVSYNGGRGGINVRPQAAEVAAMRGPRVGPMNTQINHAREAAQDRSQFYSANHGRPAIVAAPRPIAAQQGIRQPAGFQQARPAAPAFHQVNQPIANRPENRPSPAENRPNTPVNRPVQPENRPANPSFNRPAQPQNRPNQPENRPAPQQNRPEQMNRPATQPTQQYRPQQEQRPTPQPQTRPQPQPQQRPAPQARPEQPRPEAQPQSRPAAAPQSRPAPQPQQRPAPQSHPAPAPQPHNSGGGGGHEAPHGVGGDHHGR